MPLNVFEVTLYAMVMAGGTQPLTCSRQDATESLVMCTNGIVARQDEKGNIRYSNGVTVTKTADGNPSFSNGIQSHWGSAGWVQFTNDVAVRRNPDASFKNSKGLVCRMLSEEKSTCQKG